MIKLSSCDECEKGDNRVVLWTSPPDKKLKEGWHIYNIATGRFSYIGPVGGKRTNFYDKAHEVAHKRNGD